MPAIVFGTDAFRPLAYSVRDALGMPELRLVIVPHPLGGLSNAEAEAKGAQLHASLMELLSTAQQQPLAPEPKVLSR